MNYDFPHAPGGPTNGTTIAINLIRLAGHYIPHPPSHSFMIEHKHVEVATKSTIRCQ